MKIQNFAVVFIIIIMPIAMVLSIYTGNLIDVANTQASYDSILLNSTYDAIRAYQMNTLDNDYESENNSKVRDINASINSFFNSLAMGFSSSRLGKKELQSYIPAILYTLYDGYYIYGTYDNIVNTSGGVSYNENAQINKKEYGLRPYVYYSCEYQGITNNSKEYDIIVNYTLDNYITVTGKFGDTYISRSGYYIDFRPEKINVISDGTGPADFDQKIVTLYPGSENEVVILPEQLGEYLTTIDINRGRDKPTETNYVLSQENGKAKYYNYIIYNNIKYYLDDDMINDDGTAKGVDRENEINFSHNMTYDGIPIFYLDRDTRTYISQSTLDELKSYLGVDNDLELYNKNKFKDVNAYYYYFKSTQFSKDVYDVLKDIDLGKVNITNNETGESQDVIISNLPYDASGNIVDSNGQVRTGNVIKTETYHTNYTDQNGIESHVKSTYDTSKVFNFDDEENNPELESSSFNRHRIDVIISSIESSLISSMASFNNYIGATYEYTMPILQESEWDRICNNITIATFMQGLTIGNYKYYSNYAIVANTKVKDFIQKDSIFVQNANTGEAYNGEYHNPKCIDYNNEITTNPKSIVGYRNIDYDRQNCILPNFDGTANSEYWYYLQPGTGSYECVVGQNDNLYSIDELLKGRKEDGTLSNANKEIRRAYITALAREKGNSYKTYGFLNQELQQKNPLTEGEALYTVHYFYQDYDYENEKPKNNYIEVGNTFSSTALVGTPITSLTLHTTPRDGYVYTGNDNIEITTSVPEEGNWKRLRDLSSEDRTLKKGTTTHIALYFDVNTSKTKEIYYDVEYYVWDSATTRYDYRETKRFTENKWINSNGNIKVYIDKTYNGVSLAYTDPGEYIESGKTIETRGTIGAYYSNNPEFSGKTYIVRYNANGGKGTMDDKAFRFAENNQLSANRFTREGYQFAGWALSESGNVVFNDLDIIVYGTDNGLKEEDGIYYLDLYAKWKEIEYDISYHGNGATGLKDGTNGTMSNSHHKYGEASNLKENEYIREYNITLDLGISSSNFYKDGTFGVWGTTAKVTFNQDSKEFIMNIPSNNSKYSGLYYQGTNAIIKSGKTATISYEVYADRQVTLAFKKQNQLVGQKYGTTTQDGNQGTGVDFVTIPANKWTTVYFSYKNNNKNSIYDYSILSIEDTSTGVNLRIKNPRLEIINANTTVDGNKETLKVSSKFLHWIYNDDGRTFEDKAEVPTNLATRNGSVLNFVAQWEDYQFNLPEIYADGYKFKGWEDEHGNTVDPTKPIEIDEDKIFTAQWGDEDAPIVEIVPVNATSSTITTVTTVVDEGSGMVDYPRYIYYIKEYGKPDSDYERIDGGNNSEYVFRNLKEKTRYNIKVEVVADKEGNIGVDETNEYTTELTGDLYVKEHHWVQNNLNEGSETVTFDSRNLSSDDLYIEHKKGDTGEWVKGAVQYDVEHKETTYARLTDGTNYLATVSYTAIDSIAPKIEIHDITSTQDKPNTVTIAISATEEESGLGPTPKYTYWVKKSNERDYKEYITTTDTIVTYAGLDYNTLYNLKVSIYDRAGNLGETVINVQTTYKYEVEYNGNGATSGNVPSETHIKDMPFIIPVNQYKRIGYNYTGYWEHRSINEKYFDNQQVVNLSQDGSKVTLYVIWIDNIIPTIESLTKDPETEITTDVKLTAKAYDLGTGIVGWQFSTDPNLNKDSLGWNSREASNDTLTFTQDVIVNGDYYFYVKDGAGNINKKLITVDNIKPDPITEEGPKGPFPVQISTPGYYRIYLEGAGGAAYGDSPGGDINKGSTGGYVRMEVYLQRGATLYVTLGGKGNSASGITPGSGGFNGGGNGGKAISVHKWGGDALSTINMKAGSGGGGASTIANKLVGNGLITAYKDQTSALIAVAAGGGANTEQLAYTTYIGRRAETVNGGAGTGTTRVFGQGVSGQNYDWAIWDGTRQSGEPSNTEGPDGGGAGWVGGWAKTDSPRYNSSGNPEDTKTSGEGGTNYYLGSGNTFDTGNGTTATIRSVQAGVAASSGQSGRGGVSRNGYCYIEYLSPN